MPICTFDCCNESGLTAEIGLGESADARYPAKVGWVLARYVSAGVHMIQ